MLVRATCLLFYFTELLLNPLLLGVARCCCKLLLFECVSEHFNLCCGRSQLNLQARV